jgi:hypothetical protein
MSNQFKTGGLGVALKPQMDPALRSPMGPGQSFGGGFLTLYELSEKEIYIKII